MLFLKFGLLLGLEFFFSLPLLLPSFLGGSTFRLVHIFLLIVGVLPAPTLALSNNNHLFAGFSLKDLASRYLFEVFWQLEHLGRCELAS